MGDPFSPFSSEALPDRAEGAVVNGGPALLAAGPQPLLVPAGGWHRLWRARGPALEDGGFLPPLASPRSLALARGRHMRQGCRAVLLWGLAFYMALQAALFLVRDRWRSDLTETWRVKKWDQLRRLVARTPGRPLLVMLGSSRTDDAFDAECLDAVPGPESKPWVGYNFGVPMVGPERAGIYLDEMLAAGIRPRAVLIEYVPAMLNETRRGLVSEENWTFAPWLSFSDLRHLWGYWSHPRQKGSEWLAARLAPGYAFRLPLLLWVDRVLFPPHYRRIEDPEWLWGFWPHDDQGYRVARQFNAHELRRGWVGAFGTFGPTLQRLHLGQRPIQALRDLLERCRREKIATALVFMPESTIFRSWYRPGGLAEAHRLFEDLSCEYGALAIDADDWIPDTDFRDGHHVQGEGARAFTARLIEELHPLLAGLHDPEAPAEVAAAASR
jgi:hypothetical protein